MNKKLYKGTFNISGMSITLYTQAINSDKAFLNFISQLSRNYNLNMRHFLNMFDGSKDNYYVKEE